MTSLLDAQTEQPTLDPNKNYLPDLVGEGKKFKTPEDLAKGKYESDMYINTLTRQFDELRKDFLKEREENTSRAKLQELIDQVKSQQTNSSTNPNAKVTEEKPSVDIKEIETLVSSKIKEDKETSRREANFNLVKSKLMERYGNNFQSVLDQQIKDLDLTINEANELARTRPQVFIKTLGLDQPQIKEGFQSPPRNNLQSSTFKPTVEKRDWDYYQRMKMEDPVRYASTQTNVQMHKDVMELGEAFMTGDYNKEDKALVREIGFRPQPPLATKGYNPFTARDNRR